MKKAIIYSLGFILVAMLIVSCRKEDNPKLPDLAKTPIPAMTPDATSSDFISVTNPTAFKLKFLIEKLFTEDETPQKIDIVVMKNLNTGTVKTFKENVTFSSTVEMSGQQLINLFGPMVLDDQFDIGADITMTNGQKLLAFPVTGESYSAGIFTLANNVKPGSSPILEYFVQ